MNSTLAAILSLLPFLVLSAPAVTNYTVVSWNNLGMHCMDSDFSVFAILPPYNTIHAQVIASEGTTTRLLTNAPGLTVTYHAIGSSGGSTNLTSIGKGNFWDYCPALFGAALPPDVGLPVPGPESYSMPGAANTPRDMRYEAAFRWFAAYGIPITPYDDRQRPNTYPMMRVTARNASGTPLAATDIVLPVSDEMDCRLCHSSGSGPAARPSAGWIWNHNPVLDYRLNILRLHDERQQGKPAFQSALTALGFDTNGLYRTATAGRHPTLCAACHLSEALPGSGRAGIPPLTRAMHAGHAPAVDPRTGLTLDADANRTSCYACHPGSATRCLRGAMGKAVAPDGSMAMQCQSCHGNMSLVGSATRTGWLNEPNCQACHTGTALSNRGQIRFADAFESPGVLRTPAVATFATQPDTPLPGLSLYRFSAGHGRLQCSACHGSTHAEFPSALPDDNLASIGHQGHAGVLGECTACHGAGQPLVLNGGPHGMHSVGTAWAQGHGDILENASTGTAECRACHGTDYRGTVLSRALGDRTVTTDKFGSRTYWRGYQVGCYDCHDGPSSSNPSPHGHPSVTDLSASTPAGVPVNIALPSGAGELRIVSQAGHGTVGLSGGTARYYPETGYSGTDRFTYAASNGFNDSNLGTVTVTVLLLDRDGDGLPDWWEQSVFGNPTNAAAGADPDEDGANNRAEFIAGTDARDDRSRLRMLPLQEGAGGSVLIGFVSTPGRTYTLERTSDLPGRAWQPLATGIPGKDGVRDLADTNAPAAQTRYYRARITP